MTKSVVSVAAFVGRNRCHTPRHGIKEALDEYLEYSSPESLKNISSCNNICTEIQQTFNILKHTDSLVSFAFIESHTGIFENEDADFINTDDAVQCIKTDYRLFIDESLISTEERT
ncbi:hypothetical protein TNCV_1348631 [Trichonephila clavipes]|nr:hypothetical protein TNCV_1348631 [Trichonephila clavipes]